jgi:hypothetical protein
MIKLLTISLYSKLGFTPWLETKKKVRIKVALWRIRVNIVAVKCNSIFLLYCRRPTWTSQRYIFVQHCHRKQQWLPLYYYRATNFFVLVLTIQTYSRLPRQCLIFFFLSDFKINLDFLDRISLKVPN